MKSMTPWSVLMLSLVACSDAQPCVACPSIEGVYTMSWTHTSTTCRLQGPTPATITVGQVNSTMTAIIGAESFQGTLYDSYDFALTGFSNSSSSVMRGYAVPGSFADAGLRTAVTLNGTLSTTDLQSDAGCSGTDDFVGTRNLN